MTEREALKLALDALKHTHPSALTSFYTIGDRDKAIKAIKEHLAQQEQDWSMLEAMQGSMREHMARIKELESQLAQPEQEPVTLPENKKLILVDSSFDDLMYWLERCESKGHLENCSDLIEPWEKFCDSYCVWTDHHPDCKLAEQEPVAWTLLLVGEHHGIIGKAGDAFASAPEHYRRVDVYTTPPQRKPLTDEEIAETLTGYRLSDAIDITRAIEAAHGIKGEA